VGERKEIKPTRKEESWLDITPRGGEEERKKNTSPIFRLSIRSAIPSRELG